MDDVAVDECCCDVFVTFVKYFLDTKISRRVVKKYEHSKEEKGFNKNMSALLKCSR